MSQSLSRILVHLIFSTKHRYPFLTDPQVRQKLNAYIMGILENLHCPHLAVNGASDHVHIFFALSKNTALAALVEEVKRGSSKWVKTQGPSLADFYWQSGYAAFSVSPSRIPDLVRYIENQENHHRVVSFQDELREFFKKHGVEFDERYVWD